MRWPRRGFNIRCVLRGVQQRSPELSGVIVPCKRNCVERGPCTTWPVDVVEYRNLIDCEHRHQNLVTDHADRFVRNDRAISRQGRSGRRLMLVASARKLRSGDLDESVAWADPKWFFERRRGCLLQRKTHGAVGADGWARTA